MFTRLTIAVFFAALISTSATADIIIDNSSGTQINSNALGFGAIGNKGATAFTMSATSQNLLSISVGIGSVNATQGSVNFAIHADGAGVPGALIEDLGDQLTTAVGGAINFQTFNSAANPLLMANTKYWVVGTELFYTPGGGSFGSPRWVGYDAKPNTGTGTLNGGVFHNTGGGFTDLFPPGSLGLIVQTSAVPEPSGFFLSAIACIGMAFRRKRS